MKILIIIVYLQSKYKKNILEKLETLTKNNISIFEILIISHKLLGT